MSIRARHSVASAHEIPSLVGAVAERRLGAKSPPWQRRGGRGIKKDVAKPPLMERPGWFVQLPIIGGFNEPPRLRPLRRLRSIFLLCAATPPLPRRGVRSPEAGFPSAFHSNVISVRGD